jgi:hypothetical protein
MASVTLRTTCSILENGGASILAEIIDSTDIPSEILVFKKTKVLVEDYYVGVATPWEISTYPTSRNEATSFYRKSSGTLTFDSVSSAKIAKDELSSIMLERVQAYADIAGFEGVTVTELESV